MYMEFSGKLETLARIHMFDTDDGAENWNKIGRLRYPISLTRTYFFCNRKIPDILLEKVFFRTRVKSPDIDD